MKKQTLFLWLCLAGTTTFAQSAKEKLHTTRRAAAVQTEFSDVHIDEIPAILKKGVPMTNRPLDELTQPDYQTLGKLPKNAPLANDFNIVYSAQTGLPTWVESKKPMQVQTRTAGTEPRMREFLTNIQALLGLQNAAADFKMGEIEADEFGQSHIRLVQQYKGVPIYGAEAIVHEKDGAMYLFNGNYFPTPTIEQLTPALTAESAENMAFADLKVAKKEWNAAQRKIFGLNDATPELVIYHPKNDLDGELLVWKLTIVPTFHQRWVYFIDAQSGAVVHKFNTICNLHGGLAHVHAEGEANNAPILPQKSPQKSTQKNIAADGSVLVDAIDLNGVTRKLNVYQKGTGYLLLDITRPMFNKVTSVLPDAPIGSLVTLDGLNRSPDQFTEIDYVKSLTDKTGISAQYNATVAYEYYLKTFNRNSVNGKGGNVLSFINITEDNGKSMENAFWNGEGMFYGNGGKAFQPLAKALDVAGHEISHGVIQSSANLEYQDESGALNESFADIFGAMIDREDWQIGEDVVNKSYFPTGTLRDLSNPNNGGRSLNDASWQPKSVSEQYRGTEDNGGVHINSGITNYAYYLFAVNTAVGKVKAEQVYYRALTKYLTRSSRFLDMRAAAVQAATDLYGATSNEVKAANAAFDAVGIGVSTGGGGTPTPPPTQDPTRYQTNLPTNPGIEGLLYTGIAGKVVSKTNSNGTTKTTLSNLQAISKPSITDDGSAAVFVGIDSTINVLDVKTGQISVVKSATKWRNVAISKDGLRLAIVTSKIEPAVYIFDTNTGKTVRFALFNPTYTQGVNSGDVLYADAMDWNYTGEWLLHDQLSRIRKSGKDIDYWDISLIKVWEKKTNTFADGKRIEKLFSNVDETEAIGNPVYSKNSPYVIALDYIQNYNTKDEKYSVLGVNIETGKIGTLYNNTDLGYPSYNKTDTKIAVTAADAVGKNIMVVDINPDKITGKGTATKTVVSATYPNFYAEGVRKLEVGANDLAANLLKLNVAPNPFTNQLQLTFEATKSGKSTVELINVLGETMRRNVYDIQSGKNTLSFDVEEAMSGIYFLKVTDGVHTSISRVVKQ
jgi:bacillolysin